MVGDSILVPPSNKNDLVGALPQEKTGTYIGFSGDYVGIRKTRYGINVETAWAYKKINYPSNGETYRPIFTDVNALFQPRLTKRIGLDFLAGVGLDSTRFTVPGGNTCSPTTGCTYFISANHFMEDLGFGVRYRFFRRFYIRPEVHYYHVQDNSAFSSNNVFRVGASLGYTFPHK